jgi:hypothetical protein
MRTTGSARTLFLQRLAALRFVVAEWTAQRQRRTEDLFQQPRLS